ncbi:Protein of unknown function [Cotesia congregata]|uniref:Uncharacterized protein n=1 Tax=Cotesia congregata TaxID=51543 RepID=A0A8J2HHK9_COTCN|nr:Protein of unknown function [Cotesia congregata]
MGLIPARNEYTCVRDFVCLVRLWVGAFVRVLVHQNKRQLLHKQTSGHRLYLSKMATTAETIINEGVSGECLFHIGAYGTLTRKHQQPYTVSMAGSVKGL